MKRNRSATAPLHRGLQCTRGVPWVDRVAGPNDVLRTPGPARCSHSSPTLGPPRSRLLLQENRGGSEAKDKVVYLKLASNFRPL